MPVAKVGHGGAAVYLLQPVRVAIGGGGGSAALVHAQPQRALVREAVVVVGVVVLRRPRPAVVGGADGGAVGFHLPYRPGEVHRIQVHGVTLHLHAVHREVRQVARLHGDVRGRDFPRVLLPQHPGVRPRLVDRRLPVLVGERAVADERHLRERVVGRGPPLRHRAHLVLERLVPVPRHLRNGEVHRAEAREPPVAQAVVVVLRGILRGVQGVVDAHADVARLHRPNLAVLQPEGARLGLRVHAVDDAHARSAPLVAHLHLGSVVAQQRHHQPLAQRQGVHLPAAVPANLRAEARHAAGEAVLAYHHVAFRGQPLREGDGVGGGVWLVLAEEVLQLADDLVQHIPLHAQL